MITNLGLETVKEEMRGQALEEQNHPVRYASTPP